MKKLLIIYLLFSQVAFSQDLNSALLDVKKLVKEVKLEKSSIVQELSFAEPNLSELTLRVTESTAKGKTEVQSFKFDLIFFEASLVKRNDSKKELLIELKTTNSFKAVEVSKNDVIDKFDNEIAIRVDNADEARDLEKYLKNAINVAKTRFEANLKVPVAFTELQSFVEKQIRNYENNAVSVNQSVTRNETFKDRLKLITKATEAKKSEEKSYDFSWGDLAETSVKIDFSGKKISVKANTTDNLKFIETSTQNKKDFDKELEIFAANPTEAKKIVMTIQKLIPLARKELQSRKLKTENVKMEDVNKITDFTVNESQYAQKLSTNCVCNYTRNAVIKGKSKNENFQFNFSDLTDFKIDVEKEYPTIKAKTVDKLKFVSLTETDGKRSFDTEMVFLLPNIEVARDLLVSLPVISSKCKAGILGENYDWLVNKLKTADVNNTTQTLSLIEPTNRARWRFVVSTSGGKKSLEKIYEFNVYDLDVNKTKFEVEGQNLALTIDSKNKEKLIKQIEDGKPTFTNQFQMLVNNAEDLKKIKVTLKNIINNYKLLTDGKFVTQSIVFDVNSANIKSESDETIKTVAQILQDNASLKINIIGFTDSDGDDKKNLDLSKRRALAVKDKLVKSYSIAIARIQSDGKGEADPIAANDISENKALNRRVEFVKIQ